MPTRPNRIVLSPSIEFSVAIAVTAPGNPTRDEREAAKEMLRAIITAGEAAQGGIESLRSFLGSFSTVGQSARPVRRVVTRLVTAYEILITTIESWAAWGNTAQQLLVTL